MSRYSQIIYSLQEKVTHFRLEVSVAYVVLAHFELKKSDKIHQYFELYQVFVYKFLCEIVLIFSIIHIIDKKESTYFGLEARCGPKESAKKK